MLLDELTELEYSSEVLARRALAKRATAGMLVKHI